MPKRCGRIALWPGLTMKRLGDVTDEFLFRPVSNECTLMKSMDSFISGPLT